MNVLHDMFPNYYDLNKESNENRDISGDQNVSAFFVMLSLIRADLLHL